MELEFFPLRFCFLAQDSIYFPAGKPGNILRGAFGTIFKRMACVPECIDVHGCDRRAQCAYARIFEPAALGSGPSGLTDWPRPFVFRASHLDGSTIAPDVPFHFDLNVFDVRDPSVAYFVQTFSELAREGLGPRRGRAQLESVSQLDLGGKPTVELKRISKPVSLSLAAAEHPVHSIRVDYLTPTELKSGHQLATRPEFPILFARIRDRISTLRTLYGPGPLDIDFKAMGDRAASVRMTQCDLRQVDVSRRSSRTGQTHSLGGFVGSAVYEGDLAEFLPFLKAAYWTGVGRQTVWGKGEIRTWENVGDGPSHL